MTSSTPTKSDYRIDSERGNPRQTVPRLGIHRSDIQGLRAVAVIAVVLFHVSELLPGGFAGVDIFFVISGFVITGYLVRRDDLGRPVALRSFFWRRVTRLGPLLGLVVVVTLLASSFLLSPIRQIEVAAQTGIGAIFLVANVVIEQTSGNYFDLAAEANPLLNLWSLSVEEQFYLIFAPLLVGLIIVRRSSVIRGHFMVGVLTTITFVSLLWARLESLNSGWALPELLGGFYGAIPRLWEFLFGVLLALAWPELVGRTPRWLASGLGWIGVCAILYTLLLVDSQVPWPGATTLLPVAGTAFVIVGILGGTGFPVSQLLGSRPMTWIGDRSYGWYLWHWPFIVLLVPILKSSVLGQLFVSLAALALASVTYSLVEQPLRRVRFREKGLRKAVLALSIVIPVVLGGLVLSLVSVGFGSQSLAAFRQAIIQDHAGHVAGCDDVIGAIPDVCQWNTESSGRPIYLIGDSNADHFSEAIIEAGRVTERPVFIATRGACPLVEGDVRSPERDAEWVQGCEAYREGVMDFLSSAESGTVVLAISSGYTGYEFGPAGNQDGASGLVTGIQGAISNIAQRHETIWVEPIAVGSWSPQECSTISVLTGSCEISFSKPESDAYDDLGPLLAEEFGSQLVRPSELYCVQDTCSSLHNETQVFRDTAHLTVEASTALAPRFTEALDQR